MQIISNPSRETWASLLERPHINSQNLTAIVDEVLNRIRTEGDAAIRDYELQFDKAHLTDL
jgi:histidinol dehydrogenase